jgi:hypothetical protein
MRYVLTTMAAVALALTGVASAPRRQGAPMIPDTFTNLRVLPGTIPKADLMAVMKGLSTTFNVRCSYCHDATDDLSRANFASDDKAPKQAARQLLTDVSKALGRRSTAHHD